jgi:ribonuclease J
MKFKIHRGTKEIGGSCVEVWTDTTRILLDFGMPLVDEYGSQFNFEKYKALTVQELIKQSVLPNIRGLYNDTDKLIDGIILSHAHKDHFGLLNYVHKNVMHYLGKATHEIIKLNNIFTLQDLQLQNTCYFEKTKTFKIGDISITPYWADHSAFDAYSFLVEANDKRIFYSGDFRSHGRKAGAFEWFIRNAPKNIDYLLLEGTTIGRSDKAFKTEEELELDFTNTFRNSNSINYVWTSSQNIDRLVTIYKACLKSDKTFVVDVYTANVLDTLAEFAQLPTPLKDYRQMMVLFPNRLTTQLFNKKLGHLANKFALKKIIKEVISENPSKYVLMVRPSMKNDLNKIVADKGNLIYSMWDGYKKQSSSVEFLDWLKSKNFTIIDIHTSGHADTPALKQLVEGIQPKYIVPIHTFEGDRYKEIFKEPIVRLKDGEVREI